MDIDRLYWLYKFDSIVYIDMFLDSIIGSMDHGEPSS